MAFHPNLNKKANSSRQKDLAIFAYTIKLFACGYHWSQKTSMQYQTYEKELFGQIFLDFLIFYTCLVA